MDEHRNNRRENTDNGSENTDNSSENNDDGFLGSTVSVPDYGVSLFMVCNEPDPVVLLSDNDENNVNGETAEKNLKTLCRVCLSGDKKLYPIPPQNLQTFKDVLKGDNEGENPIPQRVCFECNAKMTAWTAFRSRAEQTNSLLYTIIRPFAHVSEPPNGPGVPRYIAHRPRRTPGRVHSSDQAARSGPRRLSLCLLPPDGRIP